MSVTSHDRSRAAEAAKAVAAGSSISAAGRRFGYTSPSATRRAIRRHIARTLAERAELRGVTQ